MTIEVKVVLKGHQSLEKLFVKLNVTLSMAEWADILQALDASRSDTYAMRNYIAKQLLEECVRLNLNYSVEV